MTNKQKQGNINGGITRTKHGYCKRNSTIPRIYRIWQAMKSRCYSKTNESYKNYGLIGVTVCREWLNSPESFIEWSYENGYNDNMHLDKDELCEKYKISPKVYSPKTCQWVLQHKNNIVESQLHTIDVELEIIKAYKAGENITDLAKKYYIGKGLSKSAPTKYIEELLRRYGVYKPKINKTPIKDSIVKEILDSGLQVKDIVEQYGFSRSKWYRAKKRYMQQNSVV